MPRKSRLLSQSKIYHVMIRGNEKKNIFFDDGDKEKFLEIICKTQEKGWSMYAYCLMDNHVHLLINEGEDQISRIMKRINTSYAYFFNTKYKRVGHLFQDRYKSEAIDTEEYLLAAVRYLHNNPLKAGIVKKLAQYKWSSYNAYVFTGETSLINKETVLSMFSATKSKAIKQFVEFSNQEADDLFIDNNENNDAKLSKEEVDILVRDYLAEKNMKKEMLKGKAAKNVRDELIRGIKEKANLSIREIAASVGLSKDMIQRIK